MSLFQNRMPHSVVQIQTVVRFSCGPKVHHPNSVRHSLEHMLGHVLVRHVPEHVFRHMLQHILRPCWSTCLGTCLSRTQNKQFDPSSVLDDDQPSPRLPDSPRCTRGHRNAVHSHPLALLGGLARPHSEVRYFF